jgi:hypothetical protein
LRDRAESEWKAFNRSYPRQLKFFQEIQKLHPADPWVSSQVAAIYAGQRDWLNSCSTYELLSQNGKGLSLSPYYTGICEPDDKKIKAFETMLREVPDHGPSLELLSELYVQQSRPEDACKVLYRLSQIPFYEKQYVRTKKKLNENFCGQYLKN